MDCGKMNKTQIAILELKDALADLVEGDRDMDDDLYLLRFLKYRQMDVKKAEKNIRETVQWKKDRSIEQLIQRDLHSELALHFPCIKGRLKTGGPNDGIKVSMIHAGRIDLKGLLETYGKDIVYDHVIQHIAQDERKGIEWNRRLFKERNCDQVTENSLVGNAFLVDLEDISLKQLMSVKAVSLVSQLCLDYMRYFPLLGCLCIVVNCSKVALPFVNIMKRIVEGPDLTIEIHDTNKKKFAESILKRADADQIPTNFGGNRIVQEFL